MFQNTKLTADDHGLYPHFFTRKVKKNAFLIPLLMEKIIAP